jgi:4-alpha-glucanotransferase
VTEGNGGSPPSSAIVRLAQRYGIEDEFTDAHGELRPTSAETRQALLAGMGLGASDEAGAKAALEEAERRDWSRTLEPVYVVRGETQRPSIEIKLRRSEDSVSWRILEEGGGELQGHAPTAGLNILECREIGGIAWARYCLTLAGEIPWGYHTIFIGRGPPEREPAEQDAGERGPADTAVLIVAPERCWLPPAFDEGAKLWGVSAQLYLLRSAHQWGIGDYTDLARLVEILKPLGANVVGLNPLHAMFLEMPEQASPYSPANRLLLNILNIDVMAVPELAQCEPARSLMESRPFQVALKSCQDARLVQYSSVLALKLKVLRLVFADARRPSDAPRWQGFTAFERSGGDSLEQGCLFQALQRHFAQGSPALTDWHDWPAEYRDRSSAAVARFAREHADDVLFFKWLQFIADEQLAAVARIAKPMAIGLYRDLAVGAAPAGAETWLNPRVIVDAAQVGAPPDIYNPAGQDWGLPPFNPLALHEEGYRSFIDLVRANMRHAGGLRIDHVMALKQLYWIPQGGTPAQGAYVRYPLEDLIAILALESHRNRCLVVGEDLGTVPAGFRERMAQANILSYRVLLFEQTPNGFVPPEDYPAASVAVAGSHDLPTQHAWWESRDIALKEHLALYPNAQELQRARERRRSEHAELVAALRRAGLLDGDDIESLIRAAHAYLARSNAFLVIAQLDDLTDEVAPVNVPGTDTEHANWRRRQAMTLEELAVHPRVHALAELLEKERRAASRTRSETRYTDSPPPVVANR